MPSPPGSKSTGKPTPTQSSRAPALKHAYRRHLLSGRDFVTLVFLKGDKSLITSRMAARTDHFMPAALLDSQFATLQEPVGSEHAIVVSIDATPEQVCETIVARLARP